MVITVVISINLDWLESFCVAANSRSLLQASEKLHISQPALTKQIQRLEEYYGVELFIRSPAGIELTEEGFVFLQRIEGILNTLKVLRSDMVERQRVRAIRIGALPSVASFELPNIICDWGKQGLRAAITLIGASYKLGEALQSGQIDVAVMEPLADHDPSWMVVSTYSRPFYCISPRNHCFSNQERISLDDLTFVPLILQPEGCEVRSAIMRAFHMRRMEPMVAHEAPFGETMVGFIAAGAGVAIVPEGVTNHIDGRKFQASRIEDLPSRELVVVARSHRIGKLLMEIDLTVAAGSLNDIEKIEQ